jgi:hypothetical protein
MSVFAVENYVASILNGQSSPNSPAPIQAWVQPPPVVQMATNPQVFIWGGTWLEERHTIPRGMGFKRITYTLMIWIQNATTNDPEDPYGPLAFPLLIETVLNILRTVTIPIAITDTITGQASVIQTIGERMNIAHATPVASADQRFLLNNATLRLYLVEELNPA